MADRMILQVNLCLKQIKEKFEELGAVSLNLEVESDIKILLTQKSDIGRVSGKVTKERQIEMENVVKIKGPDDMTPAFIGVTYLQGDQLILADYNNKRVILLNSSYQYIACFTLPDNPRDVCVVDHQKVCVSLPLQKTLQFLCITSGAIKPTRKVQTRYECWGVASAGNGKIAVSSSCINGKCYWSLIKSTGKEMFYPFDCQCDLSATYVTLNSSCTRVYISVWRANSLYCFDMDGRMMYKYSADNLKKPFGVATDRDDNVYVVGRGSNNIHQLTSDGTPIRIITEGIPRGSMAVCFSNSLDRFLITNDSISDSINVFRLK
ncbi:hypothetical protein CHS0354_040567 [Potamilus streckersoni]|uniref:Uncharacterized protein n=1 Tax=Potamilus streckersoni TaxID=2493646 RepID=A0AAE0VVM8_9BIVA|nr:hypothetical protein CHS0354_040567 [Potamilus streckersoni]